MEGKGQINILVTLNAAYIPHLNTMLFSLLCCNRDCFFTVYLLHSSLSEEAVTSTRQLLGGAGRLILPDQDVISGLYGKLGVINHAKKYLYICTPYLILDDTPLSALKLSVRSGVDVRIITPHKWDKWAVHMTTRSYYPELIDAGVKVYEYTDGFMHSKTFVSDDITATVGTTNLDYRSLYLHFECGVLLQGCDAVLQVKEDFLRTLDVCQPSQGRRAKEDS